MKKTVATITCNNVYNHGATLQQYALLAYLEEAGYDAYTIDYRPPYLSNHFKLGAVGNPRYSQNILVKAVYLTLKFPRRLRALKRKNNFDKFEEKFIKLTSVVYHSNDDLKDNLPKADAYICGSDQIWNSFFQNGKDPAFYLNFVPDEKLKISYAASFAIDELEESVKPLVKENVARLDAVGVRETSGVQILNDLGIRNAEQVLDPVFLLDNEHWQKFIFPVTEKFVFVYDFDSNPLIKKIALQFKKESGFAIYTVNSNINYADKNFYLGGPETFLSLVSQSKMNITNSFHSVAFSLIFAKQMTVVNRSEKINTRMRDLLVLFNLQDYLISEFQNFSLLKPIDYSKIIKVKADHIICSKKFLMNALS